VLSWIASNVPANNNECCEYCSADLGVAVDEVSEALLGADVTEDDTVKELTFEGF
jgi:hypothetical protein